MSNNELMKAKTPFKVRYRGKKRAFIVTGFTQNDPLGVGGGMLPDMPTAHFKSGGWILIADLIEHYEMVKP